MAGMFDGVCIVGAGQATYEKASTKTVQRLLYEASSAGVRIDLAVQLADPISARCRPSRPL